MKIAFVLIVTTLISCGGNTKRDLSKLSQIPIVGTWQLITGTHIEKGDTVVTDTQKKYLSLKSSTILILLFCSMILVKGRILQLPFFTCGGSYSLNDSLYTENLEYCSAREWEGNDFSFQIAIKNDTLIQSGVD